MLQQWHSMTQAKSVLGWITDLNNKSTLDTPLVRLSTMAERDPPIRPDQFRSRSGSPLAPAPAPGLAPVPSTSPSSITCTHSPLLRSRYRESSQSISIY